MFIEEDDHTIGAAFIITSTKLIVPVVTLSINDNTKFLKVLHAISRNLVF